MIARLPLPVGIARTRLLISISAVAVEGTSAYVYLLQNGRALRREITLGAPIGNQVEVNTGLAAGDRIAATPQRLTDGATVKMME
jgi:multidrug efflux pump subunit AcrA (membrane-fusion protein)